MINTTLRKFSGFPFIMSENIMSGKPTKSFQAHEISLPPCFTVSHLHVRHLQAGRRPEIVSSDSGAWDAHLFVQSSSQQGETS